MAQKLQNQELKYIRAPVYIMTVAWRAPNIFVGNRASGRCKIHGENSGRARRAVMEKNHDLFTSLSVKSETRENEKTFPGK